MAEIVNYLQMARDVLAKQTPEMSAAQRAALTIEAAARVHDNDVRNGTGDFFDVDMLKSRYKFLPLEMVGWNDTQACLKELAKVSKDFDASLSEEALKSAYQDAVMAFRYEHDLKSRRGVINYLMRDLHEYKPPGATVAKYLHGHYQAAADVADQVIEQLRSLVMFAI